LIGLEHVTKKYGNTIGVQDLSFQIDQGQIVGLLGRNGAGKTTTLNLMTGYFPPDTGIVRVNQLDLVKFPRECKRHIGYLPEKPPLYDEMTVWDYLNFVCDLRDVVSLSKKNHVNEILRVCALEDVKDRVIGHLSKGYRQRVGFAQALCGNPEIMILDEPTVGLDPMQVVEIRTLIQKLGRDHTILFSSHILSEVQQLCDRVLILDGGKLIRSFDLKASGDGGNIRIRLCVRAKEAVLLAEIRKIPGITQVEVLPGQSAGIVEVRVSCPEKDERGFLTDQIFHSMVFIDAPITQMMAEKDDLESAFIATIEGDH